MSTFNAGRTIDHSSKSIDANQIGIPSYQHGKPYMLPEKRLPKEISYRKQQTFPINTQRSTTNTTTVKREGALEILAKLDNTVALISISDRKHRDQHRL